ncbi:MAG: ComF family protein [Sneathiella sp.]
MGFLRSVKHIASRSGGAALDLLFPAQCARCREPVGAAGSLCANCWPDVTFISAPFCEQCGYPFEYEVGTGMTCGNCLADPPPFTQGRSVLKYDAESRDMILSFKHADRTDQAPVFANWMVRTAGDILSEDVLITPVPLHSRRLIKRRFNQSALLAGAIAKITNKRLIQDLLIRKRATPSQGSKSFKGRFRNVKGAFSVNTRWLTKVKGEHVILVDDVYTTGATVAACSQCLLKAGAREVSVLTLCRVVRPARLSI